MPTGIRIPRLDKMAVNKGVCSKQKNNQEENFALHHMKSFDFTRRDARAGGHEFEKSFAFAPNKLN